MANKSHESVRVTYGYFPTLGHKIVRKLARAFVSLFRLNSNSFFSTEICQLINPYTVSYWNKVPIYFKSGHGRLRWRALTLDTEEPLMVSWINTFTDQDVFLDIGANVGIYTIPAALIASRVISVELDPSNIYCLFSNVVKNKLENKITIIPFALNRSTSITSIYYRDFSMGDALQSVGRQQVLPTSAPNPFVINQISFSLDDMYNLFKLPRPTKIKIDVDGNEELVFSGGMKTILSAQEIYLEDNGLDSDAKIVQTLLDNGFSISQQLPCFVGGVESDVSRNILFTKSRM